MSEGRLSGRSDSFSIDMEYGSCRAPLQNGHCRGKCFNFQRFQAPGRCFLPLTYGSKGMQCSWFPPNSCQAPHIPLMAQRLGGPQGMGQPGDTEGLPGGGDISVSVDVCTGRLRCVSQPDTRRCSPKRQQIKISREYVLL